MFDILIMPSKTTKFMCKLLKEGFMKQLYAVQSLFGNKILEKKPPDERTCDFAQPLVDVVALVLRLDGQQSRVHLGAFPVRGAELHQLVHKLVTFPVSSKPALLTT